MSEGCQGSDLTHLGVDGEVRMVDVSDKPVTPREATASALVTVRPAVLDQILGSSLPKGDALAAARIAGIQAAKRTSEWIPLCHPIALDWIGVEFSRTAGDTLSIACTVRACGRTGVEMEALTGVAVAALTVYDMAKSADRSMVIGRVRLERKSGGRSGVFDRSGDTPEGHG